MSSFPAANYRAALLVDGDVSHAEGPSGHIEKFSDMGNFRPAPHFRAFLYLFTILEVSIYCANVYRETWTHTRVPTQAISSAADVIGCSSKRR